MAQTFTIEQIGQRAKQRNPDKLGQFNDAEIGQRLVDRNPELQKLITKEIEPQVPQAPEGLENPILGPASRFFSGVGKLVGGTILRGADVATAFGRPGRELQESVEGLDEIQTRALQRARELRSQGDVEGSTRLLKSLQQQGATVTLEDIITEPSKATPTQIAGEAATAALETAPFSKGLGFGAKAIEGAGAAAAKIPAVQKVVSTLGRAEQIAPRTVGAVKGAITTGGFAAPFGAAEALQQPDPTLSKVAGSAFDFATNPAVLAFGGVLGGFAAQFGAPVRKARVERLKGAVDDLENTYIEVATNSQGLKNKLDRAKAKTEYKNRAGTEGTDPARTLAENGVIPNQKGSKLDTFDQAADFRQKITPLHRINKEVVREVGNKSGPVSLIELEEAVVRKARTRENIASGKAKGLEKEIRQEFTDMREEFGDLVHLSVINEIKAARWKGVKFDVNRPLIGNANYMIAKSAQKTIEDIALANGAEHVAQLNRVIGDRLEAAKFLESLNGRTVKGGRLTKLTFIAIGSTFGSSPLGKILGALGGDALANLLISNAIATPLKRRILSQLRVENPKVHQEAVKWLVRNKLHPDLPLALPAAGAGAQAGTIPLPAARQTGSGLGVPVVPRGEVGARPGQKLLPEKAGLGRQETIITPFTEIEPQAPLPKGASAASQKTALGTKKNKEQLKQNETFKKAESGMSEFEKNQFFQAATFDKKTFNESVAKILKDKKGELKGIIEHPELGKLDLVFGKSGKNGFGLAKIESEHPEVLPNLGKLLAEGKVVGGGKTRKFLEVDNGRAIVSLDFLGKEKRWVLTAYTKNPVVSGRTL